MPRMIKTTPIHSAVATGIDIPAICASVPIGPWKVTTVNGWKERPNPVAKKITPTKISSAPTKDKLVFGISTARTLV